MIFQENIYQPKRKLHVRYTLNPYILLVWYQSFFVYVHWLDNHCVYIQSTLHEYFLILI